MQDFVPARVVALVLVGAPLGGQDHHGVDGQSCLLYFPPPPRLEHQCAIQVKEANPKACAAPSKNLNNKMMMNDAHLATAAQPFEDDTRRRERGVAKVKIPGP